MKTLKELCSKFFNILETDSFQSYAEATGDIFCFRRALEKFLNTGRKEDAFTVYFCFSEIFKLFGTGYDNTKKLLETLSDHEYHSGELLSKHRDHYSHSVYVFALGLSIYANDIAYRRAYLQFYGLADDGKSAFNFLKFWGMVALFHDIGYPFQLAHEQIKTYTQEVWGDKNPANPYVSFGNLERFLSLDEDTKVSISSVFNGRRFDSINDLLAYGLKLRDGYDEKTISGILLRRVIAQPAFMDHGYFSSVILAKQLFSSPTFVMDMEKLDVLTAILLHNSLNKCDLSKLSDNHPIKLDEHPLAYLLILCDELQCWDRFAYGKVSKRDPIAWKIELEIKENEISAIYFFDNVYLVDEEEDYRKNKSVEKIQNGTFVREILVGGDERKAFISSSLTLNVKAKEEKKKKRSNLYASDDNFINLCDFAKAIHISYNENCKDLTGERIDEDFAKLPLEFKVSNIEQAKSYASKLELINCFYSSKDLDYPVVESFKDPKIGAIGSNNFEFLCREEHVRWVREKLNLGWKYGEEGKDYFSIEERNRKKLHKCIVPYECLTEEDKMKDAIMIDNIIPLLKKFGNNIRIYSYRSGRKPDLVVAGIGHRFYKDDEKKLKEAVISILKEFMEENRVIVRTGYAYGADQLIAECAGELGITTKAALPLPYEDFIKHVREDAENNHRTYTDEDEARLRGLLAETAVCKVFNDIYNPFYAAGQYNIDKADKVIAIWDGEKTPLFNEDGAEINRGGTYHCIDMARKKGMKDNVDIRIIRCHRK